MRKILYCCPYKCDPTLGGAKVYIEAAKSMTAQGWNVQIISPDDLGFGLLSQLPELEKLKKYSNALCEYLKINSHKYDVVEYEHLYLPFDRTLFSAKTLMVARSILLVHQFKTFKMPHFNSFRSNVGHILKYKIRENELNEKIRYADLTLKNADLISVPNSSDKNVLVKNAHTENKIIVLPYGLFPERFEDLEINAIENKTSSFFEIAFVGTFDLRKGAREFPSIVEQVSKKIPNVKFKLLGTSAMFPTKDAILKYFPLNLHKYLDIHPKFSPAELPKLLQHSSIGLFPSHMESFGFGVLEMSASGLPVVAYDVPGPNEILPHDLLVLRGNIEQTCQLILKLYKDKDFYIKMKRESLVKSRNFNWLDIGKKNNETYIDFLNRI
jgi:glycosyltransferase involved in cell wall biosynthesis